jgi:methylenetetrahydrofolate dehydrogenase (NADP+) / methenyltetrahydrofolate cyclohydrolase
MILYGKPVVDKLYEQTRAYISHHAWEKEGRIDWYIAHLVLADDQATLTYAKRKEDYAISLWIKSEILQGKDQEPKTILAQIAHRAQDDDCVGIIIQLPVSNKHKDYCNAYIDIVPWRKDIDWLGWYMAGKTIMGATTFLPATPRAVIELYHHYQLPDWKWRQVLIIWQSNLLWKPLALYGMSSGATVTTVNIDTPQATFEHAIAQAQIIISATWAQHLITKELLLQATKNRSKARWDKVVIWSDNPTALEKKIILDLGWWVRDGKAIGDCDRKNIEPVVHAISPVPWWVWPITIAAVFDNIRVLRNIYAWKIH